MKNIWVPTSPRLIIICLGRKSMCLILRDNMRRKPSPRLWKIGAWNRKMVGVINVTISLHTVLIILWSHCSSCKERVPVNLSGDLIDWSQMMFYKVQILRAVIFKRRFMRFSNIFKRSWSLTDDTAQHDFVRASYNFSDSWTLAFTGTVTHVPRIGIFLFFFTKMLAL